MGNEICEAATLITEAPTVSFAELTCLHMAVQCGLLIAAFYFMDEGTWPLGRLMIW